MGWGAGIQTTIQAPSINQLHGPVMCDRFFVHSPVKASTLDQSGATAPSDVPAPWWHGQYLSTCLVPQLSSTDHFHELILWASQQHGFLHSFALVKPVTGNLCHNPSNSINSWHLKLSQLSMYSIPQKCLGLCNMFFFYRRPIWHQFDGSIDAPCPGTQVAAGGSALCDCVVVDLRIRSKICAGCCHH